MPSNNKKVMENIDIQQIESYLRGKMTLEEQSAFEAALDADPVLLHRMRGLVESGRDIGAAVSAGQRFGLSYARRAAAEKQLPRFSAAGLLTVIGGLQAAVADTRKMNALAPEIVAQVLQQIANRAAARG